jgi:hypothetical protein
VQKLIIMDMDRTEIRLTEQLSLYLKMKTTKKQKNKDFVAEHLVVNQTNKIICGVSKTFGEWYQKTNKTKGTKQIKFIGLQNNHHPSQHTVGNVRKAS